MSVSIKPLEDRIVIRQVEAEQTTASGLVIPDTAKEKPQEGEVVAVGTGSHRRQRQPRPARRRRRRPRAVQQVRRHRGQVRCGRVPRPVGARRPRGRRPLESHAVREKGPDASASGPFSRAGGRIPREIGSGGCCVGRGRTTAAGGRRLDRDRDLPVRPRADARRRSTSSTRNLPATGVAASGSAADPARERALGGVYAFTAYFLWGFLPLYFLLLRPTGPWELVAWRILLSLGFCAILLTVTARLGPARGDHAAAAPAAVDGASPARLIYVNWQVFILAALTGHVIETSLGYFINPIVTVAARRPGAARAAAGRRSGSRSAIAAVAVGVIVVGYGAFPWIALSLAFSFGTLRPRQEAPRPVGRRRERAHARVALARAGRGRGARRRRRRRRG